MRPIRVILVDDEEDFRTPVGRFLRKQGMEVVTVPSVEDMTPALDSFAADIVVLDIGLPGESGLDAVRRLRRDTGLGLIMVTARGTVTDRVAGLHHGADTYLPKPVDLHELDAVIRSLWARLGAADLGGGLWVFDVEAWTLAGPSGPAVPLSAAESNLMSALTDRPGAAVPRAALVEALGLTARPAEDRRLDLTVSRLRAKVKAAGARLPIQAVRGMGYAFSAPLRRDDPAPSDAPPEPCRRRRRQENFQRRQTKIA
jgi:DNA-binding response OmpR family regulator